MNSLPRSLIALFFTLFLAWEAPVGAAQAPDPAFVLPDVVIKGKDETLTLETPPGKTLLIPDLIAYGTKPLPDVLEKETPEPVALETDRQLPNVEKRSCFLLGWGAFGGISRAFGAKKTLLKMGHYEYQRGNWERALRHFRYVSEKYPGENFGIAAAYWEGECELRLGKRALAEKAFLRVTQRQEMQPYTAYASYSLGWLAFRDREFAQSRAHLQKVVDTSTDKRIVPVSLYTLAQSHYYLDDYRRAVTAFLKCIDLYPWFPSKDRAQFWAGESYYHLKEYDLASEMYRLFLKNFPNHDLAGEAWYSRAWCALGKEQKAEARGYLKTLLEQFPKNSLVPNALYWSGRLENDLGHSEDAKPLLARVLSEFPNHALAPHAARSLGWIAFREGRFQEALESFAQVERLTKDTDLLAESRFLQGECHYNLKNYASARKFYLKVVKGPESLVREALYKLGWCAVQEKDYAQGVERFREILRRFPSWELGTEVRFWLAESQYRDGSFKEAEDGYRAVFEEDSAGPWADDALLGLGWVAFQRQDWATAIEAFQRLASRFPESRLYPEALFKWGESALRLDRSAEARKVFTRLLKEAPTAPFADEALYCLGMVESRERHFDAARARFEELITVYPAKPLAAEGAFQLGKTFFAQGRFEDALKQWESFLQQYPLTDFRDQARLKMAEAHYNLDHLEQARSLYRSLFEGAPSSKTGREALYGLAVTYFKANQYDQFRAQVEGLLGKDPANPNGGVIWYLLGEAFFDAKQYDKAQEAYEKVLRNYETSDEADGALFRKGQSLAAAKKWAEAVDLFKEYRKKYPKGDLWAEAIWEQGQALERLGKDKDAAFTYRDLMEKDPSNPVTERALLAFGRIAEKSGQLQDAEEAWRRLIKGSPLSSYRQEAGLSLGKLQCGKLKKPKEALETLALALEGTEKAIGAEAQWLRGRVLEDLKRPEDAVVEYLKVDYLFPLERLWVAKARLAAATASEHLGKKDQAKTLYKKALQNNPDSKLKKEAEAGLKRVEKKKE